VSTTREKDEDRELQGEADFRVFWSELKQNGEDVDSWLKFQATNYQDVDSKHGAITHLRSFHNKLMFW